MQRDEMLDRLRQEKTWDVVIIGGGATGLGTAVDAASRGYSTVLVEAADFAKGTSSRSTKLIHGGVRYLRSGQISMVRESLLERGRLLQNAPGTVQPIRFLIPAYRFGQRPFYWLGMKLYDWLAALHRGASAGIEPARMVSRRRALDLVPTLGSSNLRGGVLYTDGQFDDSRLAIQLAQTGARNGAVVCNYLPVRELVHHEGQATGVLVEDLESGEELEISGKVIINATGVFAEAVMDLDETGHAPQASRPRVIPSMGTHLVLDREFLPCDHGVLIPSTDDGRVLFAIPWLGKTLIGTTDREVPEIETDPRPSLEEVAYLTDHVGRYLTRKPSLSDIRSQFAGLRPLVGKSESYADSQGETATSKLSREHEIHVSPSGLITIIGGKWTTYRKMAEDIIDLAINRGGLAPSSSSTQKLSLEVEEPGNSHSERNDTPLHPNLPYRWSDIERAMENEMVVQLEDILARRTRCLLLDVKATLEIAPQVVEMLDRKRGRDADWQTEQLQQFEQLALRYLP